MWPRGLGSPGRSRRQGSEHTEENEPPASEQALGMEVDEAHGYLRVEYIGSRGGAAPG